MTAWVRFIQAGAIGFGAIDGTVISVHDGDLFGDPRPTGETRDVADVELLAPVEPTKMIGLWNNVAAAAEKNGWAIPDEPLWFIKPPSSFLRPGGTIEPPTTYDGRVLFEGELGVVIGAPTTNISLADAEAHIFGYTCVNDVTTFGLLGSDPSFAQWSRAKSFDTFGPFGPAVVTGVDPATASVRTTVNGRERQNYPVSDLIFSPAELVHLVSQDMTLEPGDVIACGTSTGALPMRPGAVVEVSIDGIGTLANTYGPSAV